MADSSVAETTYSLAHYPWLFTSDALPIDRMKFEQLYHTHVKRLFRFVRELKVEDWETAIHNVIIAPELGCLTAGELALLWIQKHTESSRMTRRETFAKKTDAAKAAFKHKEKVRSHVAKRLQKKQRMEDLTQDTLPVLEPIE